MTSFLIQNSRPRKHVTIDGQVLRANLRGMSAGTMWISEDRLRSRYLTNLLRQKRIKVVGSRPEGVHLDSLVAEILGGAASPVAPPTAPPAPVPAPEALPPVAAEVDPPAEEDPPAEVDPPADPEPVSDPEAAPAPDGPGEDAVPTQRELSAMKYRELQALAREHDVTASGKRLDLLNRLISHFQRD
jgi:hypothetical protein